MSSVALKNVSRRFSSFDAIKNVSLDIRSREVVTIVGPSGCGKSTLLRIIAGLDFPSAGEVHIDGENVSAIPARLRNIAMVFQSYALYPHMTTYENLSLNLRLKKVPKEEINRRVSETARLLEIEDLLAKKPYQLSGGQRQRVAVGRALIRKPKIFLFDEPLSNLDALLRERVRHELRQLFQKLNATVVYVTHDQIEAMTLADRVVVLDRGTVQQAGEPDELYRSPANRFVASFIGSPSMNVFERRLDAGAFRFGETTVSLMLPYSGQAWVGIRPEAIRLGSGFRANVLWTESLGGHFLIGVSAGDVQLTVLSNERPAGDSVELHFSAKDIHVFDKDSGESLIHRHRRNVADC